MPEKRPGFWQKNLYGRGIWVYDIKGIVYEKNEMIRKNARTAASGNSGAAKGGGGPEAILSRKEKPAA